MSEQTVLKFHIGIPGLVSDLLPEVAQSESMKNKKGTYFLSPRDYRNALRSWVNDKSNLNYVGAELSPEVSALKKRLQSADLAIASQNSMLGSMEQTVSPTRTLPLAEKRIAQLSNLLPEFDLEFHVAIASPLDVAHTLARKGGVRNDAIEFLRSPQPWHALIKRLVHACPDRQFFVWNLDDLLWSIPEFACSFFDLEPDEIDADIKEIISDAAKREYALNEMFSWEQEIPEQTVVVLRDFYTDDLQKIGVLKNVTLMPTPRA
ncbi:MAG: hypothetical protein QNK19_03840 [Xanthomonadales bacterium]|nr:hypothetical protein [Xanthomonadales bacterium]